MIGISFWRIWRAAFQNFFRNIWLSVATTVIMMITLLIVMFLYFANVFGLQVIKSVEQKVDLAVVFRDEATSEQIAQFVHIVEARPDVESVRLVTSEEALEQFKSLNRDQPFIEESLAELDANPLPASLFIVAKEPQSYQQISQDLTAEKYTPVIAEVTYEDSRAVIERLIAVINMIKNIGLAVTGVFAFLVVLIMFNTVRLAIYSFREEIDIMHLVGASRWFIRGPFVLETILVALFSVLLTNVLLFSAMRAASPSLKRFFFEGQVQTVPFDIYQYATAHWITIIGLQTGVAVGLAAVSSLIAIQRYLRA